MSVLDLHVSCQVPQGSSTSSNLPCGTGNWSSEVVAGRPPLDFALERLISMVALAALAYWQQRKHELEDRRHRRGVGQARRGVMDENHDETVTKIHPVHVRTRPRTRRVRNPSPCICKWLFMHTAVTVMSYLCSHTPLGVDVQGIEASKSTGHSSQEQVLCCRGRCPHSGHVLSAQCNTVVCEHWSQTPTTVSIAG